MRRWLAVCLAVPVIGSSGAHAQMKGLAPSGALHSTHSRSLEFNMPTPPQFATGPQFANGMITERDVSSNAFFGMGLVSMNGRNRDGSDMRADVPRVITRNPAVTFVLKF